MSVQKAQSIVGSPVPGFEKITSVIRRPTPKPTTNPTMPPGV
jgi:hypothetical protein